MSMAGPARRLCSNLRRVSHKIAWNQARLDFVSRGACLDTLHHPASLTHCAVIGTRCRTARAAALVESGHNCVAVSDRRPKP